MARTKLFMFETKVLKEHVAAAMKVINPKSSLEVLTTVLLEPNVAEGKVKISATSLEEFIVTYAKAEIFNAETITIPAKKLLDILTVWQPGRVILDHDSDTSTTSIYAENGRDEITLQTIPALEFPTLGAMTIGKSEYHIDIASPTLARLIKNVAYAASTDEMRPILAAIHMTSQGKTITMEAADGFRLSEDSAEFVPAESNDINKHEVCIPSKAFSSIVGLNKDEKTPFALDLCGNNVKIVWGETECWVRTVEGKFPNTEALYPKTSPMGFSLSAELFYWKLRGAALCVDDAVKAVVLKYKKGSETEDSVLKIIAKNSSGQVFNTTINEPKWTGDGPESDISIAVNVTFLAETVGLMRKGDVNIAIVDPSSPIVVTPVASLTNNKTLVMPMRVTKEYDEEGAAPIPNAAAEIADTEPVAEIEATVNGDEEVEDVPMPTRSRKELILELVEEGLNVYEIAESLNITTHFVRSILKEADNAGELGVNPDELDGMEDEDDDTENEDGIVNKEINEDDEISGLTEEIEVEIEELEYAEPF